MNIYYILAFVNIACAGLNAYNGKYDLIIFNIIATAMCMVVGNMEDK